MLFNRWLFFKSKHQVRFPYDFLDDPTDVRTLFRILPALSIKVQGKAQDQIRILVYLIE